MRDSLQHSLNRGGFELKFITLSPLHSPSIAKEITLYGAPKPIPVKRYSAEFFAGSMGGVGSAW